MSQNIIDIGFDPQKFNQGKEQIVAGLTEVIGSAKEVQAISAQLKTVFDVLGNAQKTKINPNDSGYSQLKTQVVALQKEVVNLKTANDALKQSLADVENKATGAGKGTKLLTEEMALLKVQTQQANKETIAQAKAILAAQDAAKVGGETVEVLRTKLASLTADRDKKINILDPVALKAANDQIAAVKLQIDKIEQGGGNFRGNVGNYTQSINILKTALTDATAQLQRMTEAGTQNTEQGQQTAQEVSLLTELVGQQTNGFTSLAREVMNTGRALETLHEQGLDNTQAFKLLETEFTNAKRQLTEFRNEQKILTDSAPKLAALTAAARGLGGIYATGAGAAALFASDNEHVQKELNKLVAVMTLLQGLNEIHKLLMEKNAIATALFGTSTAATTIALEGEAAAATAAGEATNFFGKALAFIEANPIVIVLTALAAAIVTVTSGMKDQEEQFKETAEAAKDYSEALKTSTDTNLALSDLRTKGLQDQKKQLENELALTQGPEKRLSLQKQIAEVESKIKAENLKANPQIEGDLNSQNSLLEKQLLQQKQLNAEVEKYAKQIKEGKANKVESGLPFGLGDTNLTKNALEEVKKKQEENNAAIEKTKASITDLQKVKDENEKADQDTKRQALDETKFYSAEERKLALTTAQIEFQAVQDKNNLILSNEHSTFDQRIAAMKANQEAAKKFAKAEEVQVLTDPSKSNADRLIAEKDYHAKVAQINRDGQAEVEKETESYNKRQLTARYEAIKSNIEAEAKANEEISKDSSKSIDERAAAYATYYSDQKEMILADAEFQKATKILTDEEIVALDTQTKNKLIELERKSKEEISAIIVSGAREQIAEYEQAENLILARQKLANAKAGKDKKEIDKKNAEDEYRIKLESAEKQKELDLSILASTTTSDKDKLAAEKDLVNQEIAIDDLKTKHILDNQAKVDEEKKKERELELKLAEEGLNFIQTLVDAGYEKHKNAIQKLIDANNEYEKAETDRINNSTLAEQDKAAKLIQLKAATDTKNKQLAKEQKDEDVKKARFDKAVSIAKIIEETAVAVIKTLAETPPPAGIPLAILVGAIGAVQLAAAIATPIPTYAEGTEGHRGGDAVIGERKDKKPELVEEPSGKTYIVDKPTLVKNLPIGSRVTPLTTENKKIISEQKETAKTVLKEIATYKNGTRIEVLSIPKIPQQSKPAVAAPAAAPTPEYKRQYAPLTVNKINEIMYGSVIANTAERLELVEAAEKMKQNRDWEIARWQAEQMKEAMKAQKQQKIINKIIIDPDHQAWVAKYVEGK